MSLIAERLTKVEALLEEVLHLLRLKQETAQTRAEYQARYYAERNGKKSREGLIKNPDRNNLNLQMGWDRRLRKNMVTWAATAYRFAEEGKSSASFMEWLAYTWNNETYWHKVVTRSGGYNHLFIGFSGTRPLRCKWTDNDLFGCVKRTKFTRAQRDQFSNALWWNWGYGVLGKCLLEMQEDEERWAKLPTHFTRPMLLMMGGFGMVEVRAGLLFDPSEHDCNRVARMYAYAKPDLDRGWDACKRGLYGKEEPHVTAPTK